MRWLRGSTVAASLLLAWTCWSEAARGEDVRELPARFGVLPSIGVGVAKISSSGGLPDFIGLTTLGVEVHGEVPPYGAFARFQFNSSGLDGRWTAPSFALGGTYRLFGDGVDRLALVGRAGFLYERWHGQSISSNCPIDLFVPSNCKALVAPAPSGNLLVQNPVFTYTGDNLGLLAGARLEMPVRPFYLAVEGEVGGLVDVAESTPGTIFHFRLSAIIAFRDARKKETPPSEERGERQRRKL
jgi:hypothetical protein